MANKDKQMADKDKQMAKRMADRDSEVKQAAEETAHRIAVLERNVKILALKSSGYIRIRHRFLDVYRRDTAWGIGRNEQDKITAGNKVAHAGNAIDDADLYTTGERSDEEVFIDLYGLEATNICLLSKC
jgi:hypothetical protein